VTYEATFKALQPKAVDFTMDEYSSRLGRDSRRGARHWLPPGRVSAGLCSFHQQTAG
jgi:hypothetical protein